MVDEESLNNYAHDETENLHFLPDVVLKPRSATEIAGIMKICNAQKIPVTPRGAGTGLSGGALPHLGGVLISTESCVLIGGYRGLKSYCRFIIG